jgi:hypothetical protein
MEVDLYDDSLGGVIPGGKGLIESDDIFVQAGRQLHQWYRDGIEDALAFYLDGAIFLVHSRMKSDAFAVKLTENNGVNDRSVDEVVVEGRVDDKSDVTGKCLNSFSIRFFE